MHAKDLVHRDAHVFKLAVEEFPGHLVDFKMMDGLVYPRKL